MEITTNNVKEAQKKLSKVNVDFLEFVEKNPKSMKRSNFKLLDLNDDLFALQPWPTFINQETRETFREACEKLCELVKGIPKRVFENNPQKVSDYYGIPQSLTKVYLKASDDEHLKHLMARGDFIISSEGLRCLEYNVTPNLGGWQTPIWKSLYLNHPIIARFIKDYGVKIRNENLLSFFLEYIIQVGLPKVSDGDGEINIALVLRGYEIGNADSTGTYLNKLFKELLSRVNGNLTGSITVCDYQHLKLVGNFICFKEKKIHVIVEFYHGMVSPEVMKAFETGTIRLLNGPISELMSNKLNLAILSDYETTGVFTKEDKAVIDTYVPWTRKIVPGSTTYKTEKISDLVHFALSNKDKLVIKPSLGYGGKGVCVGKKSSQRQWEELVESALKDKNWLVQEVVHSSPGLYQAGENGSDIHDIVWGFFVFGPRYCGAWARVMPQKDNKGVVNCHQGATVSVVFEVDE